MLTKFIALSCGIHWHCVVTKWQLASVIYRWSTTRSSSSHSLQCNTGVKLLRIQSSSSISGTWRPWPWIWWLRRIPKTSSVRCRQAAVKDPVAGTVTSCFVISHVFLHVCLSLSLSQCQKWTRLITVWVLWFRSLKILSTLPTTILKANQLPNAKQVRHNRNKAKWLFTVSWLFLLVGAINLNRSAPTHRICRGCWSVLMQLWSFCGMIQ